MPRFLKSRRTWIAGGLLASIAILLGMLLWNGQKSAVGEPPQPSTTAPAAGTEAATESPPPAQPTEAITPEAGETAPIDKPDHELRGELTETIRMGSSAEIELISVTGVTAGRDIPGERSGPAVEATLLIRNTGDEVLSTQGTSVNLEFGGDDRTPAPSVSGPNEEGFPPEIDPGKSAEGTFIFAVPLVIDGDIRIIVDVLATQPNIVFTGDRP